MIDVFERAMKTSTTTAEDTKDALSLMTTRILQNQVRAEYSTGPVIRNRDVLYAKTSGPLITGPLPHSAPTWFWITLVIIRDSASLASSAFLMLVFMARSKASIRKSLPPASQGRQRRRTDPSPHSPPPPSHDASHGGETAGGGGTAACAPRAIKAVPRAWR